MPPLRKAQKIPTFTPISPCRTKPYLGNNESSLDESSHDTLLFGSKARSDDPWVVPSRIGVVLNPLFEAVRTQFAVLTNAGAVQNAPLPVEVYSESSRKSRHK